jgi:hypothetical protein
MQQADTEEPTPSQPAIVVPTPVPGAGDVCELCKRPLETYYFDINAKRSCVPCREALEGTFAAAWMRGVAVSVALVALYYAFLFVTHTRLAIMPVVAGLLIGLQVRRGARMATRARFRWLAVVCTYVVSTLTYVHSLWEMEPAAPWWVVLPRAFELPVLMAMRGQNIITLVLLAFAIHEAWQLSGPPPIRIRGPYLTRDSTPPEHA